MTSVLGAHPCPEILGEKFPSHPLRQGQQRQQWGVQPRSGQAGRWPGSGAGCSAAPGAGREGRCSDPTSRDQISRFFCRNLSSLKLESVKTLKCTVDKLQLCSWLQTEAGHAFLGFLARPHSDHGPSFCRRSGRGLVTKPSGPRGRGSPHKVTGGSLQVPWWHWAGGSLEPSQASQKAGQETGSISSGGRLSGAGGPLGL